MILGPGATLATERAGSASHVLHLERWASSLALALALTLGRNWFLTVAPAQLEGDGRAISGTGFEPPAERPSVAPILFEGYIHLNCGAQLDQEKQKRCPWSRSCCWGSSTGVPACPRGPDHPIVALSNAQQPSSSLPSPRPAVTDHTRPPTGLPMSARILGIIASQPSRSTALPLWYVRVPEGYSTYVAVGSQLSRRRQR